MKLRGTTRLAAAAAATALLLGGLATPARAETGIDLGGVVYPGAVLAIDDPVLAATAPVKGCAGIDTGKAVADKDGWLFDKPEGKYTGLQYLFLYIKPDAKSLDDLVVLLLDADGIAAVDTGGLPPKELAKSLKAKALAANKNAKAVEIPTVPAPAGVTGALTDGGGWVKTPAGWALGLGAAFTEPLLEQGTFDLVRACAAAPESTPSPAAPSSPAAPGGTGGGSLPITGTNVWILSGAGVALIAAGVALFLAYRRRQHVTFVA